MTLIALAIAFLGSINLLTLLLGERHRRIVERQEQDKGASLRSYADTMRALTRPPPGEEWRETER